MKDRICLNCSQRKNCSDSFKIRDLISRGGQYETQKYCFDLPGCFASCFLASKYSSCFHSIFVLETKHVQGNSFATDYAYWIYNRFFCRKEIGGVEVVYRIDHNSRLSKGCLAIFPK